MFDSPEKCNYQFENDDNTTVKFLLIGKIQFIFLDKCFVDLFELQMNMYILMLS